MKNYYKSIRSSTFLLLVTGFLTVEASSFGVLVELKGNVFLKTDSKISPAYIGAQLTDFTEVLTEVGSQAVISDYSDRTFHLSGASHLVLLNKMVEVKRGYLYTDSKSMQPLTLQTINAKIEVTKGNSILSYDTTSQKTQFMALTGKTTVKNLFSEQMSVVVPAGFFTFVDQNYNDGMPRTPTEIGKASFEKVALLFDGKVSIDKAKMTKEEILPLAKHSRSEDVAPVKHEVTRSIASVLPSPTPEALYLKEKKMPESKFHLKEYYEKKVDALSKIKRKPASWKPSYEKKSDVMINIFWPKVGESNVKSSDRAPASVVESPEVSPNMEIFKADLRHQKESDELINQLETVDTK